MEDFSEKKCVPCEGGVPPLSKEAAEKNLKSLTGWDMPDDVLLKKFTFKNYEETIAFVNEIAKIANEEDHHPTLLVDYGTVGVTLLTHAANGLTVNDFILAAKIDKIRLS